jgi:tetratricopeptide (TPR) repeat protein
MDSGTPRKGRSYLHWLRANQSVASQLLCGCCFFLVLGICLLIYWNGLTGPFLLDDFPNLESLGDSNQVNDLHSLIQFVGTGFAGPTGRPLSLLSFLLNDFAWPSNPWSFKYTNLLIHLLNGVLVFWVSLKLCRINTRPFIGRFASWLALGSASLWLLHPMHVSTTLYVIQRMTSLSALFSLVGMLLYITGREALESSARKGYGLITASVTLFTLLAMLSKENGALLPLLLATVEFTALRHDSGLCKYPHKLWTLIFFVIPALVFIAYLSRFLMPSQSATFDPRGFTAWERLLTESRVLIHYLYDLAIPKLYSGSVFNDDFPISKGLLTPSTTLLSLATIAILLFIAFGVRKSYPYITLAVSFFFVGHLLESTTAPLELYYEHRNYLPSIFLFMPLAYGIEHRPKIAMFGIIILFLIMIGFTAAKAKLWGNERELILFWADQHPNSARAQRNAADVYFNLGQYDKVFEILDKATAANPNNLKLRLNRIAFACLANKHDEEYFAETMYLIEASPIYFDSNIYDMLEHLVSLTGASKCRGLTLDQFQKMTDAILSNPTVNKEKPNRFLLTHLKAIIALNRKEGTTALSLFSRALELSGDPETGMQQTALLATHGFYPEALYHLAASEKLLDTSGVIVTGVMARHDYPMEIKRLRQQIQQDMSQPPVPPGTVNKTLSKP